MKQVLLMTMLMSAAITVNAGVFKCATPGGGFTYSEKPCAKESKALDFHTVQPTGTENPAGNSSDKLMEQMNQERRARKLANDAKEEEAAQKVALRRKNNCAEARRRLGLYQQQIRVYKTDENGERVYVDDDQRASIIAEAKRVAEENCD